MASGADVEAWLEAGTFGNVAARFPQGVVGVDVDAYAGKAGAATWAALGGPAEWPATFVLSARFGPGWDGSGIRLYRLPEGVAETDLWGAHQGVEIIRHGHRYAVAAGSIHPEGMVYAVLSEETGEITQAMPDVASLPVLPEHLAARLTKAGAPWAGQESATSASPDGAPCQAVLAALGRSLGVLRGASRHDSMAREVLALVRLGEQGHQGVPAVLASLEVSYVQAVQADPGSRDDVATSTLRAEWARMVDGAQALVAKAPTAEADRGCCGGLGTGDLDALQVPTAPDSRQRPGLVNLDDLEPLLFGASPILEQIRQAARARLLGPWGVLGSVLCRVIAEVPPHYVLPAYVGAQGSLNLYLALVDASGVGKSTSHAAAGEILHVPHRLATRVGQGTGEGLLATFLRRNPDPEDRKIQPTVLIDHPQVLMFVDEIGQMEAVAKRSGATVEPTLRSMWMGQDVDNNNADPDRRRRLAAHSYRLGLTAGVQPSLAGHLLGADASESGTAQRWLWMPVNDPSVPEETPEDPGPITWTLPTDSTREPSGRVLVTFPPAVAHWVQSRRRERLRGGGDDLGGHADLARMKVAAALALLHGTTGVDTHTWMLSGVLLEASTRTRQGVLQVLRDKAPEEARKRGRMDAAREAGRAEAMDEVAERWATALWRQVHRHAQPGTIPNRKHQPEDGCSPRCVTHALRNHPGADKAKAVEAAVARDWVDEDDAGRLRPGGSQPVGAA
jgi:hypothetical protein